MILLYPQVQPSMKTTELANTVSTFKIVLPRTLSQPNHTGMMRFTKQIKTSCREQSRKKKKKRMLVHQELKLNFVGGTQI